MKKFMFLLCAMTALASCSNDNENGLYGEEKADLTSGTHELAIQSVKVSNGSWSYLAEEGKLSYEGVNVVLGTFNRAEIDILQENIKNGGIVVGYSVNSIRASDGRVVAYRIIFKPQPYAEFRVDGKLVLPASEGEW